MSSASSGICGPGGSGKTRSFYGFKLYAVIDDHGPIVRFAIVLTREADPSVARAFLVEAEAVLVFGDRGYRGCGVSAQPKKNFIASHPTRSVMR